VELKSQPGAEVRETHIGVVVLVGDRAYKLKKPVNLGFLDFSTRQRRLDACHREVELNRRLAPDVYLGVADVIDERGELCDHLVVMRRMPQERRLLTLIEAGAPLAGHLRALARLLAVFHAGAQRSDRVTEQGGRDALAARWEASFEQVQRVAGEVLPAATFDEVRRRTRRFLAGRAELFAGRQAAGRVVDGHGDLIAEDVFCLDDGPRVLDCLEFDDRLRWLDGLDDAAFLAMDLEYHGRADLAAAFLDAYAAFGADPAPASLRHHYIAYRAFVRAKVACVRHEQGAPQAQAQAIAYTEMAREHLRTGTVRLVLVGGLPGTGKSTLAGRLADQLGAVLLSSDRLRKELAGLAPQTPAPATYGAGIYTPEHSRRCYAELLRRARELLARGESVVLDASWIRAGDRGLAAAVADDTHSELVALRCTLPVPAAAERIAARGTADPSDANPEIAAAMAADADPWPEAVEVPTAGTQEATVDTALVALGR
jgi:aminoglycoside phosphotransferase family enzyme/predicted kinase